MTTAKRLHTRSHATGRPQTVLTIVGDDHNVHCLDEAQLDAWWASLQPHQKADLYERELEADSLDADPVGESFVRLRQAEQLLDEARRVASSFEELSGSHSELLMAVRFALDCIGYCRRNHDDSQKNDGIPVEFFLEGVMSRAQKLKDEPGKPVAEAVR